MSHLSRVSVFGHVVTTNGYIYVSRDNGVTHVSIRGEVLPDEVQTQIKSVTKNTTVSLLVEKRNTELDDWYTLMSVTGKMACGFLTGHNGVRTYYPEDCTSHSDPEDSKWQLRVQQDK